MHHEQSRVERNRIASLSDDASRIIRPRQSATPKRLVQVYTASSLPTCTPCYYLGHPVLLDGAETEGASGSTTVDTASSIPFIFLGGKNPLGAGDIVPIYHVGGRWVTGYGVDCCQTFTVKCSGTLVVGATVTVKSGSTTIASGTTGSDGTVRLCVPAGTYTVNATGGSPACGAGAGVSIALACNGKYTINCCGTKCATCTISASSLTLSWTSQAPGSCSVCNLCGTVVAPSGSMTLTAGQVVCGNPVAFGGATTIPTCVPTGTGCGQSLVYPILSCSGNFWSLELLPCGGGTPFSFPGNTAVSYSCDPPSIVWNVPSSSGAYCYWSQLSISG